METNRWEAAAALFRTFYRGVKTEGAVSHLFYKSKRAVNCTINAERRSITYAHTTDTKVKQQTNLYKAGT